MKVTQYISNDITINKTDSDMCWRLVHDGSKVINLFESSGITHSMNTIFLANTIEECETEIYSLNLEYNP